MIKNRAAGLVIYKRTKYEILFLGLIALPHLQKRSNGIYDLPKGQRDPGETPFECAVRECYEETMIDIQDVVAGPFKDDALWFWLAESNINPTIKPNNQTGELEHLGYKWMTPDELLENCLDYLKPSIFWAKDTLGV